MEIRIEPDCNARRWISYFDLLGFSDIVEKQYWANVFAYYSTSIENAKEDIGHEPEINKTWFSDTFIFYTPDNLSESFLSIESATRHFMCTLINHNIPLREILSNFVDQRSMSHGFY